MWLDPEGRDWLTDSEWQDAKQAAENLLEPGGLATASLHVIDRLGTLADVEASLTCSELPGKLLAEKAAIESDRFLDDRIQQASEAGAFEDVARLAYTIARSGQWSDKAVLRALDRIARITGAGEHPATRQALVTLLDRLSFAPEVGGDPPRLRSTWPAYCAARAALAETSREAIQWWSRATDLRPLDHDYYERLSESFAAAGRDDKAHRAAERAWALAGLKTCADLVIEELSDREVGP